MASSCFVQPVARAWLGTYTLLSSRRRLYSQALVVSCWLKSLPLLRDSASTLPDEPGRLITRVLPPAASELRSLWRKPAALPPPTVAARCRTPSSSATKNAPPPSAPTAVHSSSRAGC